jgi:small-conductance mechanosensitive channel
VQGSLGDKIVTESAGWAATLSREASATVRAVTGFPAIVRWARLASLDPVIRERVIDAAAKSLMIFGAGGLVQLLVRVLTRRFIRALDEYGRREAAGPAVDETVLPEGHPRVRAARSLGVIRRVPGAVLRAVLILLPAAAFAITAWLILGLAGMVELFTTKMIILEAVHAYLLFWAIVAAERLVFTSRVAHWRLIDLGDAAARFLDPWIRWLAAIAILGGALADVGARVGLSVPAQEGIVKVAALAVHLGLVVVVWRSRRLVTRKLQPRAGATGLWATLGNTYAQRWHWIASIFLIGSWAVWAVQRQRGVDHILTLFGATFGVGLGGRMLLLLVQGSLDRAFNVGVGAGAGAPRPAGKTVWGKRAMRYYPATRRVVGVLVLLVTLLGLLEVWGFSAFSWFEPGAFGAEILSACSTMIVTLLVSLVLWEIANTLIDRHLQTLTSGGQFTKAGRLRTLAPLLRTCLLGTILVVVGLTALSEIGVNIGPLLAGAGIFGVALGFGSQKLVQDFITGIFLLLENAMQVGEWVTVSGLSGTVENLSVRTIRLRAGDGSVHVIPFSSVTTVTNTNRGIGNAAVSVTVSIVEDVDHVGDVLKKIASEMRSDPDYRSGIRADLALWGVDKVDASTVTLVGQIECTDAARWGVQREFNRRVKKRFQELGIRLANPAQPWLIEELPRPRGEPQHKLPHFGVPGEDRLELAGGGGDPGDSSAATRSPPPAALSNTQ